MSLLRKIKSMIRRARVSLSLPDTETYPIIQVEYLGKTANAEAIWPYGMGGRLPVDAQVFCFNIEGMEENKAGIGTTPTLRFKVNEEGEVYFGNPLTGSVTYYRSNGDIEIIGKNDQSVTLDGALNIIAINGVNITAPEINIGSSGATLRTLIDDRFEALFNAHMHAGVTTGVGTSGVPTVPLIPGAQNTINTKAS